MKSKTSLFAILIVAFSVASGMATPYLSSSAELRFDISEDDTLFEIGFSDTDVNPSENSIDNISLSISDDGYARDDGSVYAYWSIRTFDSFAITLEPVSGSSLDLVVDWNGKTGNRIVSESNNGGLFTSTDSEKISIRSDKSIEELPPEKYQGALTMVISVS